MKREASIRKVFVIVACAALAAVAPQKTIDENGLIFNPDVAFSLQKLRRAGAVPSTYTLVGPGVPLKELEGKLAKGWKRITGTKELGGAGALPEQPDDFPSRIHCQ